MMKNDNKVDVGAVNDNHIADVVLAIVASCIGNPGLIPAPAWHTSSLAMSS